MSPWGDSGDQSSSTGVGVAPAERALSFISKSLSEVQRGANRDLKLMSLRAKSFRDLANTLDKEWEKGVESFKVPLSNVRNSQSNILKKIRESGSLTGPSFSAMVPLSTITSQGDDRDFLKNLTPNLPSFRRVQSDPNFQKCLTDEKTTTTGHTFGWDLVTKKYPQRSGSTPWSDWSTPRPFPGVNGGQGDWLGVKEKKVRKKNSVNLEEWEPLRRAKESVKESLRELESTAATSKTPSEFFENVKKTEFFENVKKNLVRTPIACSLKFVLLFLEAQKLFWNDDPVLGDELTFCHVCVVQKLTPKASHFSAKAFENDVAPLGVPELLENLVRQSEPFLDQLGVKKDVSEKVCEVLRGYKRKDQSSTQPTSENNDPLTVAAKVNGKSGDDLDVRIASVVQSTGYRYKGGLFGEKAAPRESNDGRRNIAIVTTASLPWMTGTAVNPLFRAAFLAKNGRQNVTLLVPWLCQKDQELVYPNNMTFDSPAEQETYVRNWVEARVGFRPDFKISFYPGKFSLEKRSILAAGDISEFIPDKEADIAVLEEPEHLSWYYHGKRWTDKFEHVVGVVHTNYLEYVRREKNGAVQAFLLEHVNNLVCRVYCDKVIRLSGATQALPKSSICNVHGVNPQFLRIGERIAAESEGGKVEFNKGAYFLGKMIWGKGYRELVDLLAKHKQELRDLKVDVYGNGEDSAEVQATAKKHGLAMDFYKGRDHADDALHGYKVFINPSISDVVCTTTAEALAMGKIVVCANHPSNDFFVSFPNCYTYKTSEEFVEKVRIAMASEPVPLSPEQRHLLSWEAATDRFLDCAELDKLPTFRTLEDVTPSPGTAVGEKKSMTLSQSMPNLTDVVDKSLAFAHFVVSGLEPARYVSGALPGTMHPDAQHCKDLGLLRPVVQRPVYGW